MANLGLYLNNLLGNVGDAWGVELRADSSLDALESIPPDCGFVGAIYPRFVWLDLAGGQPFGDCIRL